VPELASRLLEHRRKEREIKVSKGRHKRYPSSTSYATWCCSEDKFKLKEESHL
jgi:hypothetical protein